MAKLTPQADETRLKQKLAEKRTGDAKVKDDPAFRGLSKHLKRVQRKRRRLALRKQHAAGKPTAAATQPAAGS